MVAVFPGATSRTDRSQLAAVAVSVLVFLLSGFGAVATSRAATIEVGEHRLLPNRADQQIVIHVAGGDTVAGVNLFAQVGDGGPELADYGLTPGEDGPTISSIDLVTETIFKDSDAPQDVQRSVPQVAIASIELAVPNAYTQADGILARLTIDTQGFEEGRWPLSLSGVLPNLPGGPFNTDFAGTPIEIINGAIEIGAPRGDFNRDAQIDIVDINLLVEAIRIQDSDLAFDLSGNSAVDFDDLKEMIDHVVVTWFGDANLDGVFNSTDLVLVFQAGTYEDGIPGNANWSTGDWNADGDFDSSDLVLAFTSNGFEQGPVQATSVPEPSSVVRLLACLSALWIIQRTRIARCRRWH